MTERIAFGPSECKTFGHFFDMPMCCIYHFRLSTALITAILLINVGVGADPYRPNSDGDVLETLPTELLVDRGKMVAMRNQLAADPKNIEMATAAAREFIKMGNDASDPRYYGYAQSVISPWNDAAEPPADIVRLRAKLAEKEHRYDDAIDELEALVGRENDDSQAWIELANLYCVKGDFEAGNRACDKLEQLGDPIQAFIGRVPLLMITGHAAQVDEKLAKMMPWVQENQPGLVQWVLLMRADAARILDRTDEAEQLFRQALAAEPTSVYIRRALGEFLLDENQPAETLRVIENQLQDNGSLLLATIAARRVGKIADADRWQTQMQSRFDELRLRGADPHGRFESRFELEINGRPERAFQIAIDNWSQQKESRDALCVLESALLTSDPARAKPVIDFLRRQGTEDVELLRLIQQIEKRTAAVH